MEKLRSEPVLMAGLVQAVLGLLLAFGVSMSDEQVGSIMTVTAVVLAILARMYVTPLTSSTPNEQPEGDF